MCVHPWTKGFLRPLQSGRGAHGPVHIQPGPTKLQDVTGDIHQRTLLVTYLQRNFCTRCPPYSSTVCFMVLHVFHSHKPRFLRQQLATADLHSFACRVFRVRLETMFNHTVPADFCTLRFFTFLPIGELALTEYKVSEVCFAQPSHSGAECDPRHRGADFAWESNHPNAPPLTGLSQEGTDTLTESTATPAAGPKNGS